MGKLRQGMLTALPNVTEQVYKKTSNCPLFQALQSTDHDPTLGSDPKANPSA